MFERLLRLLPRKEFRLGKGTVTRYTLFESKRFFSVYFHRIDTICQDRFHTHAFNAHVFILKGGYIDEVKNGIGKNKSTKLYRYQKGDYRYIPREMNHKLLKAIPGTVSLLFTGPYSSIWTEETDDGVLRILTKGRVALGEFKNENIEH